MSTDVLNAPAAPAQPLATVKRIAIVPAYNEERSVGRVLDELRALDPGLDVVVVSDGSTDRTAEVAHSDDCGYQRSLLSGAAFPGRIVAFAGHH